MSFGALLRCHRARAGLTLGRLARISGVNVGTIWRLERGERRPTRAHVLALTGALLLSRLETDRLLHAAGYPCSRCACRLDRRLGTLRRYRRWREAWVLDMEAQ